MTNHSPGFNHCSISRSPIAFALWAAVASAQPIDEKEKERIFGVVLVMATGSEACRHDQPALAPEIEKAFDAWRARNRRYAELAVSDPRFAIAKSRLLGKRPSGKPMTEAQCRDLITTLHGQEADMDHLRARRP